MREGVFQHKFQASWGHMDFNAHMANTAYLDLAADLRLIYFETHGFSSREFEAAGIGPVVMRDEIVYRAEIRLHETVVVGIELAGVSKDGSRFRLRNTFERGDGRTAAILTTNAGWLDLAKRRLIAPPAPLRDALTEMTRAEDFEALKSSIH